MDDLDLDDAPEQDELDLAIDICGTNLDNHKIDCVRDYLNRGCAYLLKGEYRKAIAGGSKNAEAELTKLREMRENGWGFSSPGKSHSTITPFRK